MDKKVLNNSVSAAKAKTKAALELVYNSLNQGQKKQLIKDDKVKALFDLYNVSYE